jgi:LacI family transcriptional regulator
MTVTIKQVAREAGVSMATVSRVLNHQSTVRESTRARVLEAVARLDYVPHRAARSLITRVTQTVAVVLPDVHGEFFSELIRGIDQAAQRRNYHVMVSGSHNDPDEMGAIVRATRGWVDGLILMSPELEIEAVTKVIPSTMPVVLLNHAVTDGRFECISVDNFGGALAMTRHLRSVGHRRIAFVRGPQENHDANERLRGYRDGMSGESEILIDGDFSEGAGYRAGGHAVEMRPRPEAVFAANDSMAIGVLAAYRDAGLEVPGDIAVAGFDDVPIAQYLSPALTTVRVSIDELGRRALDGLLEFITTSPRRSPQSHTLPATLVVRESCGAHSDLRRRKGEARQEVTSSLSTAVGPRAQDVSDGRVAERRSSPGSPRRQRTREDPDEEN